MSLRLSSSGLRGWEATSKPHLRRGNEAKAITAFQRGWWERKTFVLTYPSLRFMAKREGCEEAKKCECNKVVGIKGWNDVIQVDLGWESHYCYLATENQCFTVYNTATVSFRESVAVREADIFVMLTAWHEMRCEKLEMPRHAKCP